MIMLTSYLDLEFICLMRFHFNDACAPEMLKCLLSPHFRWKRRRWIWSKTPGEENQV